MTRSHLVVNRGQVLAFRRWAGGLDERLPLRVGALQQAAWAGLQDSMPRAALLSIHARVEGARASSWEHASLVQVWGPRYSTYVVARRDHALFTLGRMPEGGKLRWRAEDLADRLHALLDGRRMTDREAGQALRANANLLRYATLTGRVAIRWEGAKAPVVWTLPPPTITPREARLELARRYLHVFGPATPEAFAQWAGVPPREGAADFEALRRSLAPVRTPIGDAWILSRDEPMLRARPRPAAPARLLPSGDTYFLLQGAERALLLPDARQRAALWTSRVWPGALLVAGEIVGTWRRAGGQVTIETWKPLARAARAAVEAEAASLPLPDLRGPVAVRWS